MSAFMPKTLKQFSPRAILAGTFIIFFLPFLMVVLLPSQLDKVMEKSTYLVFHNVAEFFSIMVSLCVFSVGWYTYDQSKDRRALFLGTVFLAIGLLDFMHTLSNAAMPAFVTPNTTNKSTQFWIAARLLDASAFLASAFVNPEKQNRLITKTTMMAGAVVLTGLAFSAVTFFPTYLPVTAVQGVGLTPLKRCLEFVVIILLACSWVVYWKRMAKTGDRHLIYFLAAFIICIFSEAAFASYKTGFDTYNVLGHVYKVAAFYLIYKGIFASAVRKPYLQLSEANEQLLRLNETERALKEETLERLRVMESLHEKDNMLIHQSRLAAMGEMINNIAHQWRQPLNTVGLIVQEVQVMHDLGDFSKEYLDNRVGKVKEVLFHMSQTIDDFRSFFQPDKEKESFRVSRIVTRTLSLIEESLTNQQISVEVKTTDELEIYGYPNQYSQVLLNILINARDAFSERITDHPRLITISTSTESDIAVVTISDNAGGIPEEIIHKIFDQYFTTKGLDKGTGVGLYMSKSIIDQNMNGSLTVRNTGDGAEFTIATPTHRVIPMTDQHI